MVDDKFWSFQHIEKTAWRQNCLTFNKENEELVHINEVFQQIRYRPYVSQEDGGYICEYIACTVVEALYRTKDGRSSSKDDQVENFVFGVTNSTSEMLKTRTVQKCVLKQYTKLLVKADQNNELFS